MESIHNVKKLSLTFAEVLRLLFLTALSALAANFSMAAFVEAMLAPRVSGKFSMAAFVEAMLAGVNVNRC